MSDSLLRHGSDSRPLVAVVCSVPLIGEAVRSALEFAEVHSFSGRRDTSGLLHWLRPDVVIVDSDDDARDASPFALQHDRPLLHISMKDRSLRVLRDGEWTYVGSGEGPTPESIRNVVAGSLFARRGLAQ